jgi:hypothetical protein
MAMPVLRSQYVKYWKATFEFQTKIAGNVAAFSWYTKPKAQLIVERGYNMIPNRKSGISKIILMSIKNDAQEKL